MGAGDLDQLVVIVVGFVGVVIAAGVVRQVDVVQLAQRLQFARLVGFPRVPQPVMLVAPVVVGDVAVRAHPHIPIVGVGGLHVTHVRSSIRCSHIRTTIIDERSICHEGTPPLRHSP